MSAVMTTKIRVTAGKAFAEVVNRSERWRRQLVIGCSLLALATSLSASLVTSSPPGGSSGVSGEGTGPGGQGSLTGAATSGYSFDLPAARGEVGPGLSLSYSSAAGVGEAGVGWQLSLPSIERVPNPRRDSLSSGPLFEFPYPKDYTGAQPLAANEADRYQFSGQPLVLISNTSTQWVYRLQRESGFATFTREMGAVDRWTVRYRTGVIEVYGGAPEAIEGVEDTVPGSGSPTPILTHFLPTRWRLTSTTDAHGNNIAYVWSSTPFAVMRTDGSGRFDYLPDRPVLSYLTHIFYNSPVAGGSAASLSTYEHHISLVWERSRSDGREMLDPNWNMLSTPVWKATPGYRLSRVDVASMTNDASTSRETIRRYWLTYLTPEASPTLGRSYLHSIQLEGRCGQIEPEWPENNPPKPVVPKELRCPSQPPTTFTYTSRDQSMIAPMISVTPRQTAAQATPNSSGYNPLFQHVNKVTALDVNRDGWPDFTEDTHQVIRNVARNTTGQIHQEMVEDCATGLPTGLPAWQVAGWTQFVDPFGNLSLIGAWGHVQQGQTYLWQVDPDGSGRTWLGAKVVPTSGACLADQPTEVGGGRQFWSFQPVDRSEMSNPGLPSGYLRARISMAGDVDGDGLTDGYERDQVGTYPRAGAVHFSRRVLQAGNARSVLPLVHDVSSNLKLNRFAEMIPAPRVLADMNGDGLADAVAATEIFPDPSDGWGFYRETPVPGASPVYTFLSGQCIQYEQSNGRGQFDPMVMSTAARPGTTQLGCVVTRSEADIPRSDLDSNGRYNWVREHDPLRPVLFHDVNADGFTDVVVPHPHVEAPSAAYPLGRPVVSFGIYINQAGLSLIRYCEADPSGASCNDSTDPVIGPRRAYTSDMFKNARVLFADVDASGVDDIVLVVENDIQALTLGGPGLRAGLLASIDNGLGGVTRFHYDTYQQHLQHTQNFGVDDELDALELVVPVLVSMETTNGMSGIAGHTSTTHYRYRRPAFDSYLRSLRGFGEVTMVAAGGEAVRSTYLFGTCDDIRQACLETGDNDPASIGAGKLIESTVFDHDPKGTVPFKVLLQKHYTYGGYRYATIEARASYFEYLKSVTTRLIDNTAASSTSGTTVVTYSNSELPPRSTPSTVWSGPHDRILYFEQDVDAEGHVTETRDFGEVHSVSPLSPKDQLIINEIRYANVGAPAGRTIWRAYQQSVWSPGLPPRQSLTTYNTFGEAMVVQGVLSGTYDITASRIHATGATVAGTPLGASRDGLITLGRYSYDAYGNLTDAEGPMVATTVGPGSARVGCAKKEYDSRFARLVVAVRQGIDGCPGTASQELRSQFVTDRAFGVVTRLDGPNGNRTDVQLDAFGRVLAVFDPAPDFPLATSSKPRTQFRYDDVAPMSRVHVWTRDPNRPEEVSGREMIAYTDGLGVTRLTLAEGNDGAWIASGLAERNVRGQVIRTSNDFAYSGPLDHPSLAFPVGSRQVAYTYDGFGRPVGVWDGEPSAGQPGRRKLSLRVYAPLSVETYDAEDLLPSSTHFGTPVIAEFDGHGRTTWVHEQVGTDVTSIGYDYLPTGEPIKQTWRSANEARQTTRERTFDSLGRMVVQYEPNTNSNGRATVYAYNDAGWLVGTTDSRGCGENLAYDALGRLRYRDVSPCTVDQAPYTAPDAVTGTGTESFYRYDEAESGEPSSQYGSAASLPGRLVSIQDLGAHTRFGYDPLGRVTRVSRRLVKPGTPSSDLAQRYTEHWFEKQTQYDNIDRVTSWTTGADVAPLLVDGTSRAFVSYDRRGTVSQLQSSYGTLIDEVSVRPDGLLTRVRYGDVSGITAGFTYDETRSDTPLTEFTLTRSLPQATVGAIWNSLLALSPGEPTQQWVLGHTRYSMIDGVGNPGVIEDLTSASQWPMGAKPVTRRQIRYDDLYRVLQVEYGVPGDAYRSDTRVSPFAAEGVASTAVPKSNLPLRVQEQSFSYDFMGNITHSSSDAPAGSVERHLGTQLHGSDSNGPNQLRSAEGVTAAYDSAGNLIDLLIDRTGTCEHGQSCQQHYTYQWNETGQLVLARRWDLTPASGQLLSDPALIAGPPQWELRYAYSQGQRVLKSVKQSPGLPLYTLDVFDSLRVERTAYDGLAKNYQRTAGNEKLSIGGIGKVIYNGGPLPDTTGASARLFLRFGDHLGSSSLIIDQATGELVEKTTYDANGGVESDYRPARWGRYRDDLKFTGKEEDVEVGLVYFGARYFHPQLRRFISADPMTIHGWGADPNPYAYVGGRTFQSTDPWGLEENSALPPAQNPRDVDGGRSDNFGGPGQDCNCMSQEGGYTPAGGSTADPRLAGVASQPTRPLASDTAIPAHQIATGPARNQSSNFRPWDDPEAGPTPYTAGEQIQVVAAVLLADFVFGGGAAGRLAVHIGDAVYGTEVAALAGFGKAFAGLRALSSQILEDTRGGIRIPGTGGPSPELLMQRMRLQPNSSLHVDSRLISFDFPETIGTYRSQPQAEAVTLALGKIPYLDEVWLYDPMKGQFAIRPFNIAGTIQRYPSPTVAKDMNTPAIELWRTPGLQTTPLSTDVIVRQGYGRLYIPLQGNGLHPDLIILTGQ